MKPWFVKYTEEASHDTIWTGMFGPESHNIGLANTVLNVAFRKITLLNTSPGASNMLFPVIQLP